MIDIGLITNTAISIWNMIPPNLRDWSKSQVLNFFKRKMPDFFRFCRDRIGKLWSKVPDGKVKNAVDIVTSTFVSLKDKVPDDVKKSLFEQVTGSQYDPDAGSSVESLMEIVHTDDEKKAAALQMAYLIAVLGQMNQKQEVMLAGYMDALKMTEELKQEILSELQEAEKEFAEFAQELTRLDEEYRRTSVDTAKAKKEANDIIDLI